MVVPLLSWGISLLSRCDAAVVVWLFRCCAAELCARSVSGCPGLSGVVLLWSRCGPGVVLLLFRGGPVVVLGYLVVVPLWSRCGLVVVPMLFRRTVCAECAGVSRVVRGCSAVVPLLSWGCLEVFLLLCRSCSAVVPLLSWGISLLSRCGPAVVSLLSPCCPAVVSLLFVYLPSWGLIV